MVHVQVSNGRADASAVSRQVVLLQTNSAEAGGEISRSSKKSGGRASCKGEERAKEANAGDSGLNNIQGWNECVSWNGKGSTFYLQPTRRSIPSNLFMSDGRSVWSRIQEPTAAIGARILCCGPEMAGKGIGTNRERNRTTGGQK